MNKCLNNVREYVYCEINEIPTDLIKQCIECNPFEWKEVTLPCVGDTVVTYYRHPESTSNYGEITEIIGSKYKITLDDGVADIFDLDEFFIEFDHSIPAWSTMWTFKNPLDKEWIRSGDGVRVMSQLGFRIYCSQKFGYLFGIDGYGCDFVEHYWQYLYDARVSRHGEYRCKEVCDRGSKGTCTSFCGKH